MSKLYFKTGTMGSGKSEDLIRCYCNYERIKKNVLVFKPFQDKRNGTDKCIIKSRKGSVINAKWIYKKDNIFNIIQKHVSSNKLDAILIDEVQFLTVEQIKQLSKITILLDIPVLVYGLKTNFKGELFDSSATLISLADDIENIRNLCWCGKLAKQNARVENNEMIVQGEIIDTVNAEYTALCNKHFFLRDLGKR